MQSRVQYFVLTFGFLFCIITVSVSNRSLSQPRNENYPDPAPVASPPENRTTSERLLSDTENAYNPIPNADGSVIAFVRTGWGNPGGTGGTGRSNLVSDVALMNADGNVLNKKPLAHAFLQGWTSDGKYLICSRDYDYSLVSPKGRVLVSGRLPYISESNEVAERVAYLSTSNSAIWIKNNFSNIKRTKTSPATETVSKDFRRAFIESPKGEIAAYKSQFDADSALIPSPDEKYIAVVSRNSLEVYDRRKKSWTDFGEIDIHPDEDWDYLKPMWNPWFADSSKLAFLNASGIVISSPDGKSRQTILKPPGVSGLVAPSPDGSFIAFVTFEPRPMKVRNDLKFWGGSTIWIAPVTENSTPRPVTQKNDDTTYDLRWLNNTSLVFDRIGDDEFYSKARLWKVGFVR